MNKQGKDYVKNISDKYSQMEIKNKFLIDDSMISERAMRCGKEDRLFELETGSDKYTMSDDLRTIALTTLKEDQLNKL